MLKKPIHYMMLSGWLPIPYSHWNHLQSRWVGTNALNIDLFYNSCKIIADRLNDNITKRQLKVDITRYLIGSGLKRDREFCGMFFEDAFEMVQQSYEIQQYIIRNYV